MHNNKNIIILLWISILLSIISLFAVYLIVDYKVSSISERVSKSVVNSILEGEYKKFWWKDNYEMMNKIQLESIPKIIEQYKSKNPKSNVDSSNVNTINTAETVSVFDTSKTIASKAVTKTKDWFYMIWNYKAKISLTEYSDLECPSCNQFHYSWVIEQLFSLYPDNINFVFKHFPLNIHKQAFMEAEASECVGEIWWAEKFYVFIINTFANSKSTWISYDLNRIVDLASKIWVDGEKVKSCIEKEEFKSKIESQITEWKSLWINSTPTILIKNNITWKSNLIPWTTNIEDLKREIELLK